MYMAFGYAIKSLLLIPYEYAGSGSPEDVFDLFHSSSRIHIMCTIGKLDMQWGVF